MENKINMYVRLIVGYLMIIFFISCKTETHYEELIFIEKMPEKIEYYVGENIDLTGLKVKAVLSDGSVCNIEDYVTEPLEGSVIETIGKQTVKIIKNDVFCEFEVCSLEVLKDETGLLSIAIAEKPKKTTYYVGEKLDLKGLILKGLCSDENAYFVEDYVTEPAEGCVLEKVGKQTVKITKDEVSCEFEIEVKEKPISSLQFSAQPQNQQCELYADLSLNCAVNAKGKGTVTFVWYRKNSNESAFSKITEGEKKSLDSENPMNSSLNITGSSYLSAQYYCEVTLVNDEENITIKSDIATVTKTLPVTGLPTLVIETEDGEDIINKEDKVKSTIIIENSDADAVYENVTLSGRGNSTWGGAKKPYKFSLASKEKVLGMSEHKKWMLIANFYDNSFLKNCMAFYLSKQLEMDWTVNGKFVNLVKNGEFLGLYWLGEQIKVGKNRINIDEDNDYLIEMDVYYDETWKFHSAVKNLPYMIKNDDSMNAEKLDYLEGKISELENILYSEHFPYADSSHSSYEETFKNKIDVSSFAKFYLVNEIMNNGELGWPKSSYFTFTVSDNKLKAGPVWDFDWAAGSTATGLGLSNCIYYGALFKTVEFNQELNLLLDKLTTDGVSLQIHKFEREISKAITLDGKRWGTENRNPVGDAKENWNEYVDYLEDCINTRLQSIKDMNFVTSYNLDYNE